MKPLRISAVSYLNTFPFVYGIQNSSYRDHFLLHLDVPSLCAERMKQGEADVALVPAGALPALDEFNLLPGFCIGAVKEVKTVLLLSQHPLDQIRTIYLDFDSRTSVELVKILARHHWNIQPDFKKLMPGEAARLDPEATLVAIGDKTFTIRPNYRYVYDLATEWIGFTGLPFVFAVWVARPEVPPEALLPLNEALHCGILNIPMCLEQFSDRLPHGVDCRSYLEENISYTLDDQKMEGLKTFLGFLTNSKEETK